MYKDYKPIHSDFIIHWTGKDIDNLYDEDWIKNHNSLTNEKSTPQYIKRLKSILNNGLWMTEDSNDENLHTRNGILKSPKHSRTCFTELKLSMARTHAAEYGRLGIGFKRFFLFNRLGAPMIYYSKDRNHWLQPPLVEDNNENNYYRCFLKPMTTNTDNKNGLHYKYYDESEWRIIYSEDIKAKLQELSNVNSEFQDINKHFIEQSSFSEEFKLEIKEYPVKPNYLIPLKDRWFAMIIYPSLQVKILAQADPQIKNLIQSLKKTYNFEQKIDNISNPACIENYNTLIEIDLDACRNF